MRQITCFENLNEYYIDSEGNFYKPTKDGLKQLKLYKNKLNHYLYIGLSYKDGTRVTYRAHRVVAMTWVTNPNPEIYDYVNHINGIKWDLHPDNLEWSNNSENMIHAYKNKLWVPVIEQKHAVMVNVFDGYGDIMYTHLSSSEAARRLDVSVGTIARALRDYGGYIQSKNVYIERSVTTIH